MRMDYQGKASQANYELDFYSCHENKQAVMFSVKQKSFKSQSNY